MLTHEFWDEKHREGNSYWLTKSNPERVLTWHQITAPAGKRVLEIGIGTGLLVGLMHKKGNEVVACDISPVALERVSNIAETVLVENLADVDPVDLAICHLVFQHCTDEMMLKIIGDVHLTPSGVFSCQFAHLASDPSPSVQENIDAGRLVFRPLESVLSGVSKTAPWLHAIRILRPTVHHFEGTDIGWNFVMFEGEHP